MLKRISVRQLKVGMHLKEFCGSWMEHPFWRTGFVITNPKDIEAILASSIQEVWIDTDKGSDVEAGVKAVPKVQIEAEVDKTLSRVSRHKPVPQPVSQRAEMERAARICREGKQAVISMFAEARLGKAVDSTTARDLVQDISDSVSRNPGALISLARIKTADDYTYMHSVAVCAMMVALSKQLGLDEDRTRSAGLAGLLHDLGKAFMPTKVLNKPGTLTPQEFGVMKAHPVEGYKALKRGGVVDPVALDVSLHHHEKVDGSGYPEGLKGDGISLFAKMGAVCDVYDAITSNRPYKKGWDPAESLRKMAEWSKGHFDHTVFQAFVRSVGIYPVGSLVMMASGRIGVVTEQGTKSLTMPKVRVFFSTKSNLRIPPVEIDLSRPDASDRITGREDPAKWRFPDLNALWSGITDIKEHH
jgi:HD-GYP domain-containing protein (c-di-GMP phosphodiesterase class II)